MSAISWVARLWKDGVQGGTPITAAALNRIEDAVTAIVAFVAQADSKYSPTVHTHPVTSVVDLAEYIQDTVAALVKGGNNVTTSYDDAANTLTINATGGGGGGGTDAEVVRDTIAGALVASSGISITVDDPGDTITIAVAGVPQSAVTGLQTSLATLQTGLDNRYTKTEIDANTNAVVAALGGKVDKSGRNQPNGYLGLDANGKALPANLPAASGGSGPDSRFVVQSVTIGDGATLGPYTITHGMGTRAVLVSLRQKQAPFKEIRLVDVAHPSINALQILTDKALPQCEVDLVGVLGTTDVTPPAKPSAALASKTDTTVVLTPTGTDDVAIYGFNWFRGGSFIGTSLGTANYTDSTAAANTTYSYTATAVDTSGNESVASDALSVTTNAPSAPPSFDAAATPTQGNGARSVTVPVGGTTNKTVYASISHINSAGAAPTGVTCDGQPMTLLANQGNGQSFIAVYKRDGVAPGSRVVSIPSSENYTSAQAVSYGAVASTTVLASTTGSDTTPKSPAVSLAANEALLTFFSHRQTATAASGTVRSTVDNSSGFQFSKILEGAGASPQTNALTMASGVWSAVSIKATA